MSGIAYLFVISFLTQSALHIYISHVHKNQWLKHIEVKEKNWNQERKDLMDRLQAPSFAEYTNKVVREKKAEQPQEEVKPIDFIS